MWLQFSAGETPMGVNENYLPISQWLAGKITVKQA
jgi:hypothetical protein